MLFLQKASDYGRRYLFTLGLLVGGLSFGSTVVLAANAADEAYKQERAACVSGQSHVDRATCLKEAAAARQATRQSQLDDGASSYEQNALNRCKAVAMADREDCVRRMRGEGTVSGSVGTGGIYRELTRTIVQPVPAPSGAESEFPRQPAPASSPRY